MDTSVPGTNPVVSENAVVDPTRDVYILGIHSMCIRVCLRVCEYACKSVHRKPPSRKHNKPKCVHAYYCEALHMYTCMSMGIYAHTHKRVCIYDTCLGTRIYTHLLRACAGGFGSRIKPSAGITSDYFRLRFKLQ